MSEANWRIAPAAIPESEIKHEYTADVIVVGTGHAGTAAFRAAAEAGASVIAIEKQSREKYIAIGQDIGHINSKLLAGYGVPEVDPIEFFNEWMRRSDNRANASLVMQFAKKGGENVDWYLENTDPERMKDVYINYWPPVDTYDNDTTGLAGYKFWFGTAVWPGWRDPKLYRLTDVALENMDYAMSKFPAEVHFSTPVEQIFKDGDRVAGVIAKNADGEYVRYNANKSVILATGGFSANQEMCEDLLPDIMDLLDPDPRTGKKRIVSMSGRDGIGIKLGVWAGGRMEARPISTMGGNYVNPTGPMATYGHLWLDSNAKRYGNEVFGDPVMSGYSGAQKKFGRFFSVNGSNIIEYGQYAPPAHTGFWPSSEKNVEQLNDQLKKILDAGPEGIRRNDPQFGGENIMVAADTFEELATRLGLEGEIWQNFVDSCERYQELCRLGRDEDFGKDSRLMIEMKPPYYGFASGAFTIGWIMDTTGGLLTDEYQNVLDMSKDPIPGLYATGNCCGRRFGVQYSTPISGVSIGIAIALGREAGINAAR